MNPWPDERVVVVTDDPTAVEAAVIQLEDWGASPAVMFERGRALRALQVQEPDLVVLDFGRSPIATRSLLVTLEEVQPVLPGALHTAPLVVLAEGAIAHRVVRDARAPLHVTPHDDPDRMRAALTAALQDTLAPVPPLPAATVTAAVATAAGRALPVVPVVAAAILIAGVGAWFALQQSTSTAPSVVVDPTTLPLSATSVPTTVPPATAVPSVLPSAVPPTAIPSPAPPSVAIPSTGPSATAVLSPSDSTTASAGAGPVTPAPTIARLPVTGSR